jgi:hypothetical protein
MITQGTLATLLSKFAKEVDRDSISTNGSIDFKKLEKNTQCKELVKELKRNKVTNDVLCKKGFVAASLTVGRFL